MSEGTVGDRTEGLPFLKWPPPGLERTQGDLMQIASRAGLAGGFLVGSGIAIVKVIKRNKEAPAAA